LLLVTGSDAPLYHYPITTVSLIAINLLIHVGLMPVEPEAIIPWCLSYGDGLHPLQWISCNFLHAGWMHVIGNMIFLWPFGLLVEGKLGWLRMLVLCLAICILHASVQQVLMLRSNYGNEASELAKQFDGNEEWEVMSEDEQAEVIEGLRKGLLENGHGVSLGSSCLVFGLLAICAVWAPVNEFDVVSRWGAYEWPVLTVAAVFIVKELIGSLLVGGAISTPMLHMFGAVAGFVLGLGMLVIGWVDCEGFDIVSQVTGEKFEPWTAKELIPGRKLAEEKKKAELEAVQEKARLEAFKPKWQITLPQQASLLSSQSKWTSVNISIPDTGQTPAIKLIKSPDTLFSGPATSMPTDTSWIDETDLPEPPRTEDILESAVSHGNFKGALEILSTAIQSNPLFKPSASVINRIAEGLIQTKQFDSATKVFNFGIKRYPATADRWRLRVAQILITIRKDLAEAAIVLQKVNRQKLNSPETAKFDAMLLQTKDRNDLNA